MKERWGCVLLSGGRGRRMGGFNKAELLYKGETFGSRIGRELKLLPGPWFFSAAAYEAAEDCCLPEFVPVYDRVKDGEGRFVGPMGGICSCLMQAAEQGLQGLFFVSCDMPLFRKEMALALMDGESLQESRVWRTRDGRIHPVCGYYPVKCLPLIQELLAAEDYRLMNFISCAGSKVLNTADFHLPDLWFRNINSPEAYEQLKAYRPPVLAVSGRKNTGKTTCLEGIVKLLSSRGYRVAVIKHDGHDFVPDTPGTDSFRMKAAGAMGTVVYSGSRFSLVKDEPGHEAADFLCCFPEADIILLEGQKNSDYSKIEVMRREISTEPVARRETVVAYVRDWQETGEIPSYLFEDTERIGEAVIRFLDRASNFGL